MTAWPPSRVEVAAAFDARADSYDDSAMHRAVATAVVDRLDLAAASTVLDAAAGTALAGRRILSRWPGLRLVAVDLSLGLLAAGRRADPRVEPVGGDLERLPLRDGAIDAVVCVSALAYVRDPGAVVRELARVTRSGGHVAVQVWAADGLLLPRLFREAAATAGLDLLDPNAALGSAERVGTELAGAGFAAVAVTPGAWTGALPRDPTAAWSGLLASPVGAPVRALPAEARALARASFVRLLRDAARVPRTDRQPYLVATARRP